MQTGEVVSFLAKTELFWQVDDASLEELARSAVERNYKKGQIVFTQGDPSGSLYFVMSGRVKVFVTSERGDEMVFITLGPLGCFGELALVDGLPRSATVEVVEACRLLVLQRDAVRRFMHDHPQVTDALLRMIGSLVRRLSDQAADFVFLDLHGRLAKLLIALAEENDEDGGKTPVVELPLTQSDLARMVGGTRQSVNQILHIFADRGYIELDRRKIVLKRLDALRRRGGVDIL